MNSISVNNAVSALLKWKELEQSSTQKLELIPNEEFIYLILTLKKIPAKPRTNAYKIPLPHPLHSSQICLIVDDRPNSIPSAQTVKQIIRAQNLPIAKIIKLSKLKSTYKPFQAKRKLCHSYDLFLVDKRVLHFLPKLIGNSFFKKKKIPIPVDMEKNWKGKVERAVSCGLLYFGKGTCCVIKVGRVGMERGEIVENVREAVHGVVAFVPKQWGGVRSLHLKFADSVALPLYQVLPDFKLKIEGLRKDVADSEKDRKSVRIKKDKGRIHEVCYMDDVGLAEVNEKEDIQEAHAGQIGIDCASGDTFSDGRVKYTMTSMNVPEPVMSLALSPVSKDSSAQFSKAVNRFQREDPTFRVGLDPESSETIISGMGEWHLDIYVQRMQREYKVDATVGKPRVNFREALTQRAEFDYTHKKQSGGQGQYARVVGYVEPLPLDSAIKFEFHNDIVGQAVPSNFIPAIEKGFKEAANSGSLIGHPVEYLRVVLTDGNSHAVDSSELAFKLASIYAFRQCYTKAKPTIFEPVMLVELKVPMEFQGTVTGDINKRKGLIVGNDQEGDNFVITAHVPLNNMFGYSTALRSMTQGIGEFTMEYKEHLPVSQDVQLQLVNAYKATKGTE